MFFLPPEPRYILCKFVPKENGKTDKIPLDYRTLTAHDAQDEQIYLDYNNAKSKASLLGSEYGIGFVFLAKDKYFFVDVDSCLTQDNDWSRDAYNILSMFPGAYAEVSNSGRGIHIIAKHSHAQTPKSFKNSNQGVELYTWGRFCALTETNAVGDARIDCTQSLDVFITQYQSHNVISPTTLDNWTCESLPEYNVPADNQKLIEFLLNRKPTAQETFNNIVSFKDLFEANESVLSKAYPSVNPNDTYDQSKADAALVHRLHYFLGGNCQRVLDVMWLSKLVRDKWNREDYLPNTIRNSSGRHAKCFVHPHEHPNTNPISTNIQQKILSDFHYPELSGRGKPLDTSTNLKFLLDTFNIDARWNIMSRVREIKIPDHILFKEDEENAALRLIEDIALLNEMPIVRIDRNLNSIAQENRYHPIVEGLKNNPWDGLSRLADFINTIESSSPNLSFKLIRRWMIAAVAAAHSERGFQSSGVLVLSGEQYIGKTRWIKSLDPFNCDAVKSGALLDPTNKDCVRTLASYWIAELGELDGTFRKSDIARIKSFITEDIDKIRFPHERKDSLLHRRTVFAASVNDPKYLIDETGNRRWWTIPVISIDLDHTIDMVQVWAEVFSLWNSGEQTYMNEEEFSELNIHNKEHEQINPLEEAVRLHFDFSEGWEMKEKFQYSATEVLSKIGYTNINKAQSTHMGKLLMELTGVEPKRDSSGRSHSLVLRKT